MRAAWSLFGLVLTLALTSCSSSSKPAETGPVAYLVDGVPAGFRLAGAAQLGSSPQGTATALPYAVTLYATAVGTVGGQTVPAGSQVAVFRRDAAGSQPTTTPPELAQLGPKGLAGVQVIRDGVDQLFVSRVVSVKALAAFVSRGKQSVDAELAKWQKVAAQPDATVPGNGSLPMPARAAGFETSYIADVPSAAGDQRSIAVGSYQGSEQDLAILDWWYGSFVTRDGGGHVYTLPAYSTSDGEPAPDATVSVFHRGQDVLLVRTVGLSQDEVTKMLATVHPKSPSEWLKVTNAVRGQDLTHDTVLAKATNGDWQLTRSDDSNGQISLCLVVAKPSQTACVVTDSLTIPDGQLFGLAGEVGKGGDGTYVFGTVATNVTEVNVPTKTGSSTSATLAKLAGGGQLFVAAAAVDHGAIEVQAVSPSGQDSRKVPVDS